VGVHVVCACVCIVIKDCDVPLKDILDTHISTADEASTDNGEQDKPLKDADRIADASAPDKTFDKPKKTRSSLHKTDGDADDKIQRDISADKIRKRRQRHSSELRRESLVDDTVSSVTSAASPPSSQADTSLIGKEAVNDKKRSRPRQRSAELRRDNFVDDKANTGLVGKETVSEKELRQHSRLRQRSTELHRDNFVEDKANTGLIRKETVSDKEHRQRSGELQGDIIISNKSSSVVATASPPVQHTTTGLTRKETVSDKERRRCRSRKSVAVSNIGLPTYSVGEKLNNGSGTAYRAAADVSYGSEAVEDVIQRLLDNDELMDESDQPVVTSLSAKPTVAAATTAKSVPSIARGSADKPVITSPRTKSTSAAATTDKLPPGTARESVAAAASDTRRNRDVVNKSGRSLRSVGQTSACSQLSSNSPDSAGQASVNSKTSGQPSNSGSHSDDVSSTETSGTSRGPRIKHVCRYASIALGKPVATFPPVTSSQLQLSALPSQEKERILVEKTPGMHPLT